MPSIGGGIGANISSWLNRSTSSPRGLVPANGPFGNHPSLATGLVSAWPLNVDGTDSVVASGNNLTNNNGVTFVPRGPSGVVAQFTAANSESLSSTAAGLDAQRSFSFWFRRATTGNVAGFPPLVVRDFAARGMEVYINNGTEQFSFSVTDSGGTHTANGPIVSDTNWHFISVWADVSGLKVWLKMDAGSTYSVAFNGTFVADPGTLSIGSWALGSFDGNVTRVGLWSSEIGEAKHDSLYNSGTGKSYSELTTAEKVGLVSYWNLDEASGNRVDSHGSNTLTDNNTVTSVNSGPSGVVAEFTQANTEQLTHADNADLSLAGAKTWVAWVRPANAASSRPVFAKRDAGSVEYQLLVDASNALSAFVEDSSSGNSSFGSSADALIPVNTWNFCVWWYDPADKKIHGHVNLGTEQLGSALGVGPIDGTQTFSIGESASLFWYGGNIARAGIWGRVVSAADLLTLFNSGVGKSYSALTTAEKVGLVSYWNLDEVSGNRADSHGSNTLTDNNTVTSVTNAPANMPGTVASFVAASSQYFSRADDAALSHGSDSAFTLAVWAKLPSALSGESSLFVKWGGGGTGLDIEHELKIVDSSTDYAAFSVGNNSIYATKDTFPNAIFTLSAWHLVVAWHDPVADTINIQVNGGTVYSGAWTGGTFDGNGTFALGRSGSFSARYWEGGMSSLVYWSRVLTAQERTDLFNSGNGLFY